MDGYLFAMLVLPLAGLAAAFTPGDARRSVWIAAAGNVLAICLAIPSIYQVLYTAEIEPVLYWRHPFPATQIFVVQFGVLSAYFAIPVLLVSTFSSIFAIGAKEQGVPRSSLRVRVGLANGMTALMMLVLIARNGWLFLIAWECMTLLATIWMRACSDRNRKSQGEITFFLLSQLSTLCLLAMFYLWQQQTGSFDFLNRVNSWQTIHWHGYAFPSPPSLLLLLALCGFGTTAGLMPFHFWMLRCYPHLPGHVVAVFSGGMNMVGFYGILRVISMLGHQHDSLWNTQWGVIFIMFGLAMAVSAGLQAMPHHDLRHILTLSAWQQSGIITLGIGIGFIGQSLPLTVGGESTGNVIALLGYSGALLHVLNHAMFISLLWLGMQAMWQASGSSDLNQLGGLAQRLPLTTTLFIIGSCALCGFPPLNGFASLFLMYLGAMHEEVHATHLDALPALMILGGLAFVASLNGLQYVKVIGTGLLGLPRSEPSEAAHEVGLSLKIPLLCAAGGCVLLGVFSTSVVLLLQPVLQIITIPTPRLHLVAYLRESLRTLEAAVLACGLFSGLLLVLVMLRRAALSPPDRIASDAWNGGNRASIVNPQLNATSFAATFLQRYPWLSLTRNWTTPTEITPHDSRFASNSHTTTLPSQPREV